MNVIIYTLQYLSVTDIRMNVFEVTNLSDLCKIHMLGFDKLMNSF